ncbi:NAD(P)/FAD-dependent oxidoreductase [Actinomadura formosensis]|uniref:NAD(P)/FAD-dependent oxidoreductase n=1 Tax=Actinomadura formosensis TaxID=60706 RepID=UPI000831F836|nr:FAD-dependent oxidoreductase [Actinomadura formosensis]
MQQPTGFDVAVVGAGPIGAATARHLADQGAHVLIVGPAEPPDYAGHDGVWSGHYDQGRLGHILEVPLVASLLAARSIRRFGELTERTGVEFTHPVHSLAVMPAALDGREPSEWFDLGRLKRNAEDVGHPVEHLSAARLRDRYPGLTFEPGHECVVQRDALIVNPRGLTAAELTAATAAGATLVRDEITAITAEGPGRRLTARSGSSWTANTVVVATGASTNAGGLLPRRLAMDTFGATVVLVEVPDPAAVELPAIMYFKQRGQKLLYGGIVMSPLRYPDGRWYIKCSGDSLLGNPLTTRDEISAWVRTGGSTDDIAPTLTLLRELLPAETAAAFGQARVRPCLVSSNHTGHPYIDHADENLIVVVEGERGVMAADELGRLTASLASTGRWSDGIPHQLFQAEWL